MKIQIKHKFTESVLFEGESSSLKEAIEKAVKGGANLVRANLVGANLVGANLVRANLVRANLVRANLVRANLVRANLVGANLVRANLVGANLDGANLVGANLDGANLVRANLDGAKEYSESHDIFLELVRREKSESFTEIEWSIIGKLSIHRLCWGSIKKRFGHKIISIFEKLASTGFEEYLERYTKMLEETK